MSSQRLSELTKDSKTSAKNKSVIVKMLSDDFVEQKNYTESVTWLLKSHYSVARLFFEQNIFDNEDARTFEKAIETSEALSKKGRNHFARLWTICASFFNKEFSKDIISDLAYTIIDYGRDTRQSVVKYSSSLKDEFINHIVNQKLLPVFLTLPESATMDLRRRILSEFINEFSRKKEQNPSDKAQDTSPITAEVKTDSNDDSANPKRTESEFDMGKYAAQLTEQLDRLIKLNDTVSMLKTALASKEKEIEQLTQSVTSAQDQAYTAEMESSDLKAKLALSESKAEELDARLKQLYETDNAIGEQELLTLKKNVSDALKMEYSDFKESDDTVTEDNFMANYASLDRIFRILIRFGFDLEG